MLGKLLPKEKEEIGVVQFTGVLRRCSGEVEGLQWWGRGWSSSMAWGLREMVRGANEGERESWEKAPR